MYVSMYLIQVLSVFTPRRYLCHINVSTNKCYILFSALNGRWLFNVTTITADSIINHQCRTFLNNEDKKAKIKTKLDQSDPCPCSLGDIQDVRQTTESPFNSVNKESNSL